MRGDGETERDISHARMDKVRGGVGVWASISKVSVQIKVLLGI